MKGVKKVDWANAREGLALGYVIFSLIVVIMWTIYFYKGIALDKDNDKLTTIWKKEEYKMGLNKKEQKIVNEVCNEEKQQEQLVIRINNSELTRFVYNNIKHFRTTSDELLFSYVGKYTGRETAATLNKHNIISWSTNLNKPMDNIGVGTSSTSKIYYTTCSRDLAPVSLQHCIKYGSLLIGSDVISFTEYVSNSAGVYYDTLFTTLNKHNITGLFEEMPRC